MRIINDPGSLRPMPWILGRRPCLSPSKSKILLSILLLKVSIGKFWKSFFPAIIEMVFNKLKQKELDIVTFPYKAVVVKIEISVANIKRSNNFLKATCIMKSTKWLSNKSQS